MTRPWTVLGGVGAAVAAASVLAAAGCESCPFQITGRLEVRGSLAPGEGRFRDVDVSDEESLEVDVSNTGLGGGRVDAWLTRPDCAQLFDGPYPGPGGAARCPVLIGPVASGSVSARLKVSAARYRVFVYASSSNSSEAGYDVDLGRWGRTCRSLPKF